MWGPLAIRAEIARTEQCLGQGGPGGHMAGLSMDLWKYYDLVGAPTAIDFLQQLGLHQGVARALRSFYAAHWRLMSINGVTAPGLRAKQSVLQGCAWSNPCAAAYATAWAVWVESRARVHTYSYADH